MKTDDEGLTCLENRIDGELWKATTHLEFLKHQLKHSSLDPNALDRALSRCDSISEHLETLIALLDDLITIIKDENNDKQQPHTRTSQGIS